MSNNNLILMCDSYKMTHYLQYPPGTRFVSSYIESRGGEWNETLFFGLQMFLMEYLTKPITRDNIKEAFSFAKEHGVPFNSAGWNYILNECDGFLPLEIQAVKEGTVVPTGNVLVQVKNTDPNCFWLTSYIETALLRAVWYPTTVATNSFQIKRLILQNLKETGQPGGIHFKLHDFGARGVSSAESAAIGGCAHLVNFKGSDTVEGVMAARKYYGERMAAFSIPAAEHSTITSWGGREHEIDAFRNMLAQFAKPGSFVAVVSDSYDIYNACANLWGNKLKDEVINSGATVVVRPDSGDPTVVPIEAINILMNNFGYTTNDKGYHVLPPSVRVIQGDGINYDSIKTILDKMRFLKISGDNLSFGMGGQLLQSLNRDTMKFAMKCSAIMKTKGVWEDVYKDPVTDQGKRSKRGRLALIKESYGFDTVREDILKERYNNELKLVFYNGHLTGLDFGYPIQTLDEIRKRSEEYL